MIQPQIEWRSAWNIAWRTALILLGMQLVLRLIFTLLEI